MHQTSEHHYQRLIEVFERCFKEDYNTVLVPGEDEPYYQPANQLNELNQIVFAHGFFASALHETAHWCIAGEARREQFDYGYWYEPDGRNHEQQKFFEQVERKPQALEWLFSLCCGFPFQVSVDNLNGVEVDRHAFAAKVAEQLFQLLENNSLPTRAVRFAKALCHEFNCSWPDRQAINL
ncbi:elongation factor P hydroxylase [Idiomarina aminovorans]|uniref:elongation factor P hydroxylase n=1 Tax=Idiomarina aminovorans TaxID=2914829 RepID=UPI002003B425|nr:elongation factor P hydroxylase [Idiomarina sp. ATCH4]MCK7460055.1 elongation factor P hydroxylase [Idiomarina sp. ATCH4]